MIKKFCDACLNDISSSIDFSYLCHLDDNVLGIVDGNGNRVSRRKKQYDLCAKCYNTIMMEAVKKFREIKGIKNEL